jgi:hypothetical protein
VNIAGTSKKTPDQEPKSIKVHETQSKFANKKAPEKDPNLIKVHGTQSRPTLTSSKIASTARNKAGKGESGKSYLL